jgi:hypothetical protein
MADDATTTDATTDSTTETPADRTFTQAELDRVVQDRIARERSKYEGFDDLKKKAEQFDKLQQDQLSELERANAAREKAQADATAAIDRANQTLIRAEILAAATKHKAVKPEHLHRLIDTDTVTVGDDGQVTGAEEAVQAFLEANPEYVGKAAAPTGDVDQGARKPAPNQLTREELASMTPEQIRKAVTDGRAKSLLGT